MLQVTTQSSCIRKTVENKTVYSRDIVINWFKPIVLGDICDIGPIDMI